MLGALTAQLHNQASTWAPPSDFTRHAWDADGLAGERPVWGRFWELRNLTSAQRSTLEHARSRLRRDLLDFGTDARVYSLIHADLVPDNLLVDGDTMRVLDFDDCGFGWHLFDVATVFYTMRTRDYFDAAKTAFLGAYRTVRPLTDEDLSLMPMFTAARALTYLGWLHTRGDGNPDSEKRAAASTVATVQEYVS
jgi:Ser/Thr protein kinase RdoA (MazF antagonist)